MRNVVLDRSQLVVIVPDDAVFDRPLTDSPNMPSAIGTQEIEDQRMRYEAWNAAGFVGGGASVFSGVCRGNKVYVVVPRDVYDDRSPPRSVLTKREDDETAARQESEKKTGDRRIAAARRNAQLKADFHWMPKNCGGVAWGVEQRILAFTQTKMLVYKPGHSGYVDRMSGSVYDPAELVIYTCKIVKDKPTYPGTSAGIGSCLGLPLNLPTDFRLSPKHLRQNINMLAEALGVDVVRFGAWRGEKTLDLR